MRGFAVVRSEDFNLVGYNGKVRGFHDGVLGHLLGIIGPGMSA